MSDPNNSKTDSKNFISTSSAFPLTAKSPLEISNLNTATMTASSPPTKALDSGNRNYYYNHLHQQQQHLYGGKPQQQGDSDYPHHANFGHTQDYHYSAASATTIGVSPSSSKWPEQQQPNDWRHTHHPSPVYYSNRDDWQLSNTNHYNSVRGGGDSRVPDQPISIAYNNNTNPSSFASPIRPPQSATSFTSVSSSMPSSAPLHGQHYSNYSTSAVSTHHQETYSPSDSQCQHNQHQWATRATHFDQFHSVASDAYSHPPQPQSYLGNEPYYPPQPQQAQHYRLNRPFDSPPPPPRSLNPLPQDRVPFHPYDTYHNHSTTSPPTTTMHSPPMTERYLSSAATTGPVLSHPHHSSEYQPLPMKTFEYSADSEKQQAQQQLQQHQPQRDENGRMNVPYRSLPISGGAVEEPVSATEGKQQKSSHDIQVQQVQKRRSPAGISSTKKRNSKDASPSDSAGQEQQQSPAEKAVEELTAQTSPRQKAKDLTTATTPLTQERPTIAKHVLQEKDDIEISPLVPSRERKNRQPELVLEEKISNRDGDEEDPAADISIKSRLRRKPHKTTSTSILGSAATGDPSEQGSNAAAGEDGAHSQRTGKAGPGVGDEHVEEEEEADEEEGHDDDDDDEDAVLEEEEEEDDDDEDNVYEEDSSSTKRRHRSTGGGSRKRSAMFVSTVSGGGSGGSGAAPLMGHNTRRGAGKVTERKREQNRESARRFRERIRSKINSLEATVTVLERKLAASQARVRQLEEEREKWKVRAEQIRMIQQ